jgi:hypothetical protein
MNDPVPDGWVRGKKGHIPKKLWVNNNVREHYILLQHEEEYIINGFSRGRLAKESTSKQNCSLTP